MTIYNLAEEIRRLCKSDSTISCIPWNKTDVELRIPNIDKAKERLGFKPKVDLEEGLLKTIAWYREHIA
mgnify:FL=1